ncbi:MAG: zinc ribbon domain-containing protein [Candidatus Burarchaeum sp.]|nr:zinc ribbon domain-containing protein [Candidatus Burarchaeum sp.]MDO8339751.1 zinc ribbon domain-containing protein [Candidatus Burarchaeum sp.]
MAILDLLLGRIKKPPSYARRKENCPSCSAELTLGMQKCPKCGKPLAKLFYFVCPSCNEHVAFGERFCPKCKFDFEVPSTPPKTIYRCPRCGYSADYYMLSCPACNTRFV